MPTPREWFGSSHRLTISFVLVLLVPAIAVVWLSVRLIDQDRALASRQLRERRESAADRFVAGLEQAVSETERRLSAGPTTSPFRVDDDAVLIIFRLGGVDVAAAPLDGPSEPHTPDCAQHGRGPTNR